MVCSHVHAMRHGVSTEDGSRRGTGRVGAAKGFAAGKTGSSAKGASHSSKFDPRVGRPASCSSASCPSACGKTASSGTQFFQKTLTCLHTQQFLKHLKLRNASFENRKGYGTHALRA